MRTMTKILFLLLAAALLGPAAAREAAAQAALGENPGWKPVTIVYVGDVGGKIEPCG
ncbi:MAG TPA: hypothetical protein P5571_09345 [Candidatus Krumholzibacteria bacterium]|nr:hypothetical protein [Candidatus Krumholzibacteria bacterium]